MDIHEALKAAEVGKREGLRGQYPAAASILASEVKRLRAENAALRKDANRYRWLREHSTQPMEPWSTHEAPVSLDTTIDAAMKELVSRPPD